jgi:hypothetical protein
MPEKNLPAYVVPLGDLKEKYSISSLAAFLADPLQTRPSGRMPHLLTRKDANDVANYLLQGAKVSLPLGPGTTSYSYFEGNWDQLPDFSKIKANANGTAPAFDLSVARRDNDYGILFEGAFSVATPGNFRFTTTSDDGSRVLIDGKRVVNNDGIHAPKSASGRIDLTKGVHKVVVEFFQGGGGAELKVEFEGPGIARQDFSTFVSASAEKLEKKSESKKTDENVIEFTPGLIEKGKALFASAGCANCHQMTVGKKLIASELTAISQDKLKSSGGCLADKPAKGLPHFGLSAAQQKAFAAAIAKPPAVSTEPAAIIARTMTTLNCYACHSRDKIGGPTEELNKSFQTVQPEMGDEGRVPPMLDGVGAKLNPEYLKQILDKGTHDRPYMHTNMPGFGAANTGFLVALFASLDKVPEVAPVKFTVGDIKVKATARHLVGDQAFSCIKCHTFNGVKAEGIQGIDMTIIPKRVQRDWFFAYLLDPQKIRPGTRMPSAWPNGVSSLPGVLDGSTPQQIESIWVYLKQGSSAALPLGMGKKSIPLVPIKEAIIYRNFIEGAGTRAIGVGYPERINLAFDANELRLAMIWQGAFIDAARHWTDRGVGFEGPLGDNVLNLPGGAPFAVLDKTDSAWPKTQSKDQGYKFDGYKLTPDDRPTFNYSFNDVKIEDFPNPSSSGNDSTLKRTIRLSAAKGVDNLYFRAAIGNKIEAVGDGTYKIDNWKIKVDSGVAPKIRQSGGKSELLVPLTFKEGKAELNAEYVW